MKKITLRAFSVLTSAVLAAAAMPFSSYTCLALSESGIADMSGVVMKYGDFSGESDFDVLPAVLSSNDDEDYLLGAHLDANNTAVYAGFAKLVNPSLESFTVKLPEPVTFTSESKSYSGSQEFYNAVFGACASGMEAASYDIPMLFWLDINLTSVTTSKVPYTYNFWTGLYTYTLESITFNPEYGESFSSLDEVMEYKALLEDAVENFTADGDTVEEQLKSIHDHICLFTEYDIEGRFISSALGALVESGSVCEGYSKGFKILADKLGIPTVCIFGNYNEEAAEAHMWNYVRMDDGFWYAVDVTWDDYDGKYGIDFNYNYFLKGSDDFFVRHTPCDSYSLTRFEYPEIASWNYGENPAETTTSTTTTTAKPTTTSTTTTTSESTTTTTTTTTAKPTTTTTTTTAKPTTTTTTTTTAKPTTTSTTTTTAKPTTTSTTTTTAKPTTTSTTTTTAKPTTTSTTTATAKPTTTSMTTTTAKPTTTSTTTTIEKPITTSPTTVYPEFQKGDLNHDSIVSAADLVYCANYVLGKGKTEYSCDVNGDGTTDAFDVVEMRKIVIFKNSF